MDKNVITLSGEDAEQVKKYILDNIESMLSELTPEQLQQVADYLGITLISTSLL